MNERQEGTSSMMVKPRKSNEQKSCLEPGGMGQKPVGCREGAAYVTADDGTECRDERRLMEAVVERANMTAAYNRVVRNKGAAGVDGMTVDELKPYIHEHWARIKSELLEGRYIPHLVKEQEIPKPDGGVRKLGIPVVVDRMIGQGLHQALEPKFAPGLSEHSYGFMRGRNAHQALEKARSYVGQGYRWVVDIDLEKFFDRVNHDILMSRIARKVKDKRVLRLIREYLKAGILADGLETVRMEGTPQGSPLSPLLSNIMLDDLDKELERRNHKFVRYADDCNIYVKSRRAGERVMKSITQYLEQRLKLKVNAFKSAVDRPWNRTFLGYTMSKGEAPKLYIAPKSVDRLKEKLRQKLRGARGRAIAATIEELRKVLIGWINYFRLSEGRFIFERLDKWIRHKIRCIIWRQWKTPGNRRKQLMKRGLDEARAKESAGNGRGPWWNSGASHMNQVYTKSDLDRMGLVSLLNTIELIRNRT